MTKKELKQKCADLGIDTQGLDTNAELEAAILAKETELAQIDVTAETGTENAENGTVSEETATENAETETTSEETGTENTETGTDSKETEAASEETGTENTETGTDSKETEAASEETVTGKSPEAKKAEEKEVPVYKDSRGRKWSFKAKAPGTLNIGGHPMTQEEILNSEEVITELVYGNSSYLTQID
jgi:hypothetical protein